VDQRDIIGHADGFIPVLGLDAGHGYFVSMIRFSNASREARSTRAA
jgi:hypothetical protein